VNREVRFGEQHGAGDALRRKLMEGVADHGQPGRGRGVKTKRT
jgi:hypothetical protein